MKLEESASAPGEVAFRNGWRALDRGNPKGASEAFRRAASSENEAVREDAAFWYGVTLARSGDRKSAIGALQSFLGHYPRSAHRGEASALLGRLLLEQGDKDKAARHYREAADDPNPEVQKAAKEGLRRAQGSN